MAYIYMLLVNIRGNSLVICKLMYITMNKSGQERNSLKESNTVSSEPFQNQNV